MSSVIRTPITLSIIMGILSCSTACAQRIAVRRTSRDILLEARKCLPAVARLPAVPRANYLPQLRHLSRQDRKEVHRVLYVWHSFHVQSR